MTFQHLISLFSVVIIFFGGLRFKIDLRNIFDVMYGCLKGRGGRAEKHQLQDIICEVIIKVYFKKFPSEPNLQLTCKTTIRPTLINIKMTALTFHYLNSWVYIRCCLAHVEAFDTTNTQYQVIYVFPFFITHKVYSFCYAKSRAGRKKCDCHRRNC